MKKFAINSLQEKFMQQENTSQLNDYYKSLEAGKIKPKESLPTTMVISNGIEQASLWPGSPCQQQTTTTTGDLTFIQFEICKKLCEHYEKLDDNYIKFTRILNAESKFAQLASKFVGGSGSGGGGGGGVGVPSIETVAAAAAAMATRANNHHQSIVQPVNGQQHYHHHHHQRHGHLYFRIGLFGRSLKFECVQNQYFLYRHKSYEMLSNIQSLIISKIANCAGGGGGHDVTRPVSGETNGDDSSGQHKVSRIFSFFCLISCFFLD